MMIRKTQLVQVVNNKSDSNYLKGQAFNASYALKKTTTDKTSQLGIFSQLAKFFATDKVEVKRLNQLPINLLHKIYSIDKDSKKSPEKQI